MSSVVFDIDEFLARFPHIQNAVTAGKITTDSITAIYDSTAQWLGADDGDSFYPYDPDKGIYTRKNVLYLATCHMVTLELWSIDGQPGRVASASQGSVSTSFDLIKANSEIAQWWFQTPCGQQYWMMTAAYRKGGRLYVVKKHHPFNWS